MIFTNFFNDCYNSSNECNSCNFYLLKNFFFCSKTFDLWTEEGKESIVVEKGLNFRFELLFAKIPLRTKDQESLDAFLFREEIGLKSRYKKLLFDSFLQNVLFFLFQFWT